MKLYRIFSCCDHKCLVAGKDADDALESGEGDYFEEITTVLDKDGNEHQVVILPPNMPEMIAELRRLATIKLPSWSDTHKVFDALPELLDAAANTLAGERKLRDALEKIATIPAKETVTEGGMIVTRTATFESIQRYAKEVLDSIFE